ncbi:MAG: hypothetical protein EB060_12645, partial [Proteobacteria bacterium]|nr:hypothetical protein [Pseudomonadota bacterium]
DGRREHKPANTVVMKYDDGTISFMPWAEFRFTVTPWDRQNRRPLRERGKENGALPRVDQEGLDQLWAKFNQGLGQKTK